MTRAVLFTLCAFVTVLAVAACDSNADGVGSPEGGPLGSWRARPPAARAVVAARMDAGVNDGSVGAGFDASADGATAMAGATDCGQALEAPAEGALCTVRAMNEELLLLRGRVLAPDAVLAGGAVLIDRRDRVNGVVACVGCDCAGHPLAEQATVLSCPDAIISPGLVNPHEHLSRSLSRPVEHKEIRYDHRHQWRLGLDGHEALVPAPASDASREAALYVEARMLLGGATSLAGGQGAAGLLRNLDHPTAQGGVFRDAATLETFPLGDFDGERLDSGCD